MDAKAILGTGCIILLFIIFFLIEKFQTLKDSNDALENDIKNQKKEFDFCKRELERCKNQIKIYEKSEQNNSVVKVFGNKQIKVNPIYKGKRVLIGDYMEDSYENTINILRSFGIIVDVVHSGEDIIDKIKHGYKCDIIFTNNIYNKGSDGPVILDRLKEIKGFRTPVIIHTVSSKRSYFMGCGFDEYIEKPIDAKKIKPILEKFLGSR